MGGHVVGAFKCVDIIGGVFRNETVENGIKVMAHVGIGIFVQREGCRCVLDEQVEDSGARQDGQLSHNIAGYKVAATRIRTERYFGLINHFVSEYAQFQCRLTAALELRMMRMFFSAIFYCQYRLGAS